MRRLALLLAFGFTTLALAPRAEAVVHERLLARDLALDVDLPVVVDLLALDGVALDEGGGGDPGNTLGLLGGASLVATGVTASLLFVVLGMLSEALGRSDEAFVAYATAAVVGVGGILLGSWMIGASMPDFAGAGGEVHPARVAAVERQPRPVLATRAASLTFTF